MKLSLLRKLSSAEQKEVYRQEIIKIRKSYKELCQLGTWSTPTAENGYTLWTAK